jgi:hypothetical protein
MSARLELTEFMPGNRLIREELSSRVILFAGMDRYKQLRLELSRWTIDRNMCGETARNLETTASAKISR